jgi:hypothetical protein
MLVFKSHGLATLLLHNDISSAVSKKIREGGDMLLVVSKSRPRRMCRSVLSTATLHRSLNQMLLDISSCCFHQFKRLRRSRLSPAQIRSHNRTFRSDSSVKTQRASRLVCCEVYVAYVFVPFVHQRSWRQFCMFWLRNENIGQSFERSPFRRCQEAVPDRIMSERGSHKYSH